MAGTLDDAGGLTTVLHIHTASMSAFHSLPEDAVSRPDGAPDKQKYPVIE